MKIVFPQSQLETVDQKLYSSILNGNSLLLQFLFASKDLDVNLLTPIKINKFFASEKESHQTNYLSVNSNLMTETIFSTVLETKSKVIINTVLEKLDNDWKSKDNFNSTIEKYVSIYADKMFKENNLEAMIEIYSFLSEALKKTRKSDGLLINKIDKTMMGASFNIENKKTWEYLVAMYDQGFLKTSWFNEKIDCSSLWIQEHTQTLSRIEYYILSNIENQNYEIEIIDSCKILSNKEHMPTLNIRWEDYYINCWKNCFDFFEEPLKVKINNSNGLIRIPHKTSFIEANNLNSGIVSLSKKHELTEDFKDWVDKFSFVKENDQKYNLIKGKIESYLLKKEIKPIETKKNKQRF